jgi:hypothetical protein
MTKPLVMAAQVLHLLFLEPLPHTQVVVVVRQILTGQEVLAVLVVAEPAELVAGQQVVLEL